MEASRAIQYSRSKHKLRDQIKRSGACCYTRDRQYGVMQQSVMYNHAFVYFLRGLDYTNRLPNWEPFGFPERGIQIKQNRKNTLDSSQTRPGVSGCCFCCQNSRRVSVGAAKWCTVSSCFFFSPENETSDGTQRSKSSSYFFKTRRHIAYIEAEG